MSHIFCKYTILSYSIFLCTAPWIMHPLSIEETDLINTLNNSPIHFDISDVCEGKKTAELK